MTIQQFNGSKQWQISRLGFLFLGILGLSFGVERLNTSTERLLTFAVGAFFGIASAIMSSSKRQSLQKFDLLVTASAVLAFLLFMIIASSANQNRAIVVMSVFFIASVFMSFALRYVRSGGQLK